ncbi:hypothetical protein L208DRAFT_1393802 [Tricholoma matsutake]|nr:hypothetical protein L208DRAFT_1393802 [Tricholoma matsutake 945]
MRRHEPLPREIELSNASKVLDVGAGTLVWTLDVASLPEIKHRLVPMVSNPIHLYACDITNEKFPPSHELEPLGITTFVHDVTIPFPEDLNGTFDLVHMRLLCSALSEEGWKKSLKHIHAILKPGGILLLWDCDSVWFPGTILADRYNFDDCREGTSWIHKLNCIVYGYALRNQLIPDPSQRLPSLLSSCSFFVKHLQRQIGTFGKLCEMANGPHNGASLEEDRQFSIHNLGSVVDAFSRGLLHDGALEAPRGHKVTTEEERKTLLEEIMNGCREDGTYTPTIEVVAYKTEY